MYKKAELALGIPCLHPYIAGMKYLGEQNFQHATEPRIGLLLVNLGTPDAPTPEALRRYLKEFLWDPRVVEVPRPVWWLVLNGFILNVRPKRSAESYRSIWTEAGSPLMVNTRNQAEALQAFLARRHRGRVVVDFAMRYGNPSMADKLQHLWQQGVRQLVVLPMYPQYSGSTTGSVFDALAADFRQRRWLPELRFVNQYHDHPAYISAVASSIRNYWGEHGRPQKLLFSYHGEPQRYFDAGDPYHCQCHKTSRLIAERLHLDADNYQTTFQSRFGREPWLQPYTDAMLTALPSQGCTSVQVVCPGFSADCLETLEEIEVENRGYFLAAGGEKFGYIRCLNARPDHIEALADIVEGQIGSWLSQPQEQAAGVLLRAQAQGARQ